MISQLHSSFCDGGGSVLLSSLSPVSFRYIAWFWTVFATVWVCLFSPPLLVVVSSRGRRVSFGDLYIANVLLLLHLYMLVLQVVNGDGESPLRSLLVYFCSWGLSGRSMGRPLKARLGATIGGPILPGYYFLDVMLFYSPMHMPRPPPPPIIGDGNPYTPLRAFVFFCHFSALPMDCFTASAVNVNWAAKNDQSLRPWRGGTHPSSPSPIARQAFT